MLMGRMDHTDNEIEKQRKELRELHDQISKSLFERLNQTN